MTKLLTFKHWQFFGLLIGFPIIFKILLIMGSVLISRNLTILIVSFPIILILFAGIFFIWLYALGTNLYKKLPEKVTMNLTKFRISLFIPFVYVLFLCIFMFVMFSNTSLEGETNSAIFVLIGLFFLISIFSTIYSFFFIAKAIKTVELQRPLTFRDFADEFFLLWFIPFGIWIIQPRINKLFEINIDNNIN